MVIYVENLKELSMTITTTLKTKANHSKVKKIKGYYIKINCYPIYTSNVQLEFEMKTPPFTLVPKSEIFKYRSNRICVRSIRGRLHNSENLNKETKEELNR